MSLSAFGTWLLDGLLPRFAIFLIAEQAFIIASMLLASLATLLAMKARFWPRLLIAGFFSAFFLYSQSLFSWLMSLDADSLFEINADLNFDETTFFFSTLPSILYPKALGLRFFVFYTGLIFLTTTLTRAASSERAAYVRCVYFVSGLLALFSGLLGFNLVQKVQENSRFIFDLRKSWIQPIGKNRPTLHPKLFLYIGESTSSMHMGIYGYPRNTTPMLEAIHAQDKGFVLFQNVYSEYTHTTPSLLHTFSTEVSPKDSITPGLLNLFDLIRSNGMKTSLFSNQRKGGSWNLGSQMIFERFDNRMYFQGKGSIGNIATGIPVKFDHQIVEVIFSSKLSDVTVFHSYAGHGDYLENLPTEFHSTIDELLTTIDESGIFGHAPSSALVNEKSVLEAYDSAVRYVDFSVATAIKEIEKSKEPVVFVYFSDHGESPFTNAGHDSSRFIDEMARTPLFIYFNPSFRNQYPDIFLKYKEMAENYGARSLSQLAASLLEIIGLDPASWNRPSFAHQLERFFLDPIKLDDKLIGSSFIESHLMRTQGVDVDAQASTRNAFPTLLNLYSLAEPHTTRPLCYHRSNTFAKAVRGSFVTNCIEVDVEMVGDRLELNHPPLPPSGIPLKVALDIAKLKGHYLWLDFKSGTSTQACILMLNTLLIAELDPTKVLVEFPSKTDFNEGRINACVRDLQRAGFRVALYAPEEDSIKCISERLTAVTSSTACTRLKSTIVNAKKVAAITDITYDINWTSAIAPIAKELGLTKNVWGLRLGDLQKFRDEDYNFSIVSTNFDPNTR
jgi:glucan phosphoethanolaminetransferase (alkaline phosphatase superfamily)